MSRIRVLIADDVEETRNVVKKILGMEEELFEVVGEAANGEEVINIIPRVTPDVVLMDINMPVLNGLEATEIITRQYPSVIVIIMSVQGESEYLKKAMLYGAKEYIIKPFNYDTLIETVRVTFEKNKDKTIRTVGDTEKVKNARIISFASSKGGVGKSVLALNSAIFFSKVQKKRTLLIDMDLLFGDISMLINRYSDKTIIDLIDEGIIESYDNIKSFLYNYSSNLHMLFGPKKPEAAEYINKESVDRMINILRKHYDVIIFDTAVNYSDITLYILDISDVILFITGMDIVSLKNTKLGLGVMQSLGYDRNKVKLVINKYNDSYGVSRKEIEETFKDGVFAVVPDDEKTINLSINKGQPFCDDMKLSKIRVVKAVEEMCSRL